MAEHILCRCEIKKDEREEMLDGLRGLSKPDNADVVSNKVNFECLKVYRGKG